ncbi:LuxR C-terminal-related transcriptional regulator [Loktanella sp. S4079]|uniref:LuxR C-terminal-related transcriptional regulator n=1 Tax=Loktanella sp. S4079 TaxID=579483 RepID=UPI0005FA33F2|nr:response regulator transcription factor [Loktanella sp. S4079]KJZ20477.1 chemotaxis protein CheY [Loktanella sp. S4079]
MRVLIADDHDLLRDTLVLFLENGNGINVTATGTLADAHRHIQNDPAFDLVILDYNMPGMNGLEGLTSTLELGDGQRVALISGEASKEIAEQALEAGAAGFVPKTLPAKSMINAIRFMAMGEQYAPLKFMTEEEDTPKNALAAKLTPRERDVLKGLTEGKSNKQIARDFDISEPTVKLHMKTLFRKLDATNRTQAAMIAREAGLF